MLFRTFHFACVALFFVFGSVVGQEKNEAPQRGQLKIKVIDSQRRPIEGALVIPTTMATLSRRNSNFSWIDNDKEANKNLTTDANGEATINYPLAVSDDPLVRMSFTVGHDRYVPTNNWVAVPRNLYTAELAKGYRIAATAVDAETDQPITENLYGVSTRNQPLNWQLKKNGTLVSPPLRISNDSIRLVQIVDGVAVRFSDLIPIQREQDATRILLKRIPMHPAISIKGKLSNSVKRPIASGLVSACVSSANPNRLPRNTEWHWTEYAKIKSDGTFTIPGMPRDGILQLYASAPGWTQVPAKIDRVRQLFPSLAQRNFSAVPHFLKLENRKAPFTLPMQKSGTLEIKVKDEQNQPVASALVGVSPPLEFFLSGYVSGFCSGYSRAVTAEKIRFPNRKNRPGYQNPPSIRFMMPTDEHGTAVVKNLPAGGVRVHVQHAKGEMKMKRRINTKLTPGQSKAVNVQLLPLGRND